MELNTRAKQILELARKYSNQNNISTMGSEFLILAMYETEDSLCHFLLNEYEVTKDEILDKTKQIFILRKNDGEYNKSLEAILNQATDLAGDKKVSEEHLFMSVLMTKNTIAIAILESLGLNIDDLIEDVKEIYDFSSNSTDELPFIKNITKMAKNGELQAFIERKDYINKINIIMHRRFKNNPLLIGNAGVGKTALVEGYATKLIEEKKDLSILSLNLTAMLAGTRYRGDFEERFDKFMKEIASRKNVVVFIDEIHTIMGAATTEGNLDVANMLKPFLARSDIRLIGATTLEEYHKTIEKDKALLRRFQPVFVSEPSLDETKEILYGIKEEYEKYHNVKISHEVLDYLIEQSNKKIVRRFRPDKCIDILDDAMSLASIKNKTNISIVEVDNAIEGNSSSINKEYNPIFKELDKYRWLYKMDLLESKPLLKISFNGNQTAHKDLINDVLNIFNLGMESVLEIDLNSYKDGVMLSSLIGAPPGYVGYDDEGILPKHLLEYPMAILSFKGFNKACGVIKSFISNMITRGSFIDQRGRNIELNNTIVIIEGVNEKRDIGFNKITKSGSIFDVEICEFNSEYNLNSKYEQSLKRLSYEVSFDFDINFENKKSVDDYLYKLLKDKEKGVFKIRKEQIEQV